MMNRIKILLTIGATVFAGIAALTGQEKPYIIFVTENSTAKVAVEELVADEYNVIEKEKLRLAGDLEAWAAYEAVEFRGIPRAAALARYNELMSLFGLTEEDFADRGFSDLLVQAGYDVYRTWSEFEEDPITGVVTANHEFWGEGEAFSPTGDYKLAQEQIDRLNAADLIVFSRNTTQNRYSAGGRIAGEASMILNNQWNAVTTPIIIMDAALIISHEFGGIGWGLSYGFVHGLSALAPFDRREIQGSDRFVFPDLRPKVRQVDEFLFSGLNAASGQPLAIYLDYEDYGILPRTVRKFSNNNNYLYPANARVLLELDVPSFVVSPVGDIPHQNPVAIEFQKGILAYSPQNGVPLLERVGTPAETRLYFAAGAGTRGVYNLGAAGERFFLNAVEKYAGPGAGGGTIGWTEDPNLGAIYQFGGGWAFSPTLRWIHTGTAPWFYHHQLGYVYWIGGTLQSGAWFSSLDQGFFHVVESNDGWVWLNGQWIQL